MSGLCESGDFFTDELSNLTFKNKGLINRANIIGTK